VIDPDDGSNAFMIAVEEAVSFGGLTYGEDVVQQFDIASQHVLVLLEDAAVTFERASYGTSAFLAITALEETSKAEILAFRIQAPGGSQRKGRDPLRSHTKKHALAVRPTTFMGRLPSILGEETCARLRQDATTGTLNRLREEAVYFGISVAGTVTTPANAVSKARAAEILLLSLQAADDILVGWTNESYTLTQRLETLIAQIAGTNRCCLQGS
jgi:AbiV family abortive infection protein